MLHWMRSRTSKDEGFTLVELMVVVLIIAILIAIAIPTFLGARRGAQDRAAQSQIRNALVAEKAYFVDNEVYTAVLANLTALEPNLDTNIVLSQEGGATDAGVCVDLASESGTDFRIFESATDGTFYTSAAAGALGACPAVGAAPAGYTTDGW